MKADVEMGSLLLMTGSLRIRTWWRWVPLYIGPVYVGRRWWHLLGWRGLNAGFFRWSYYVALVRL